MSRKTNLPAGTIRYTFNGGAYSSRENALKAAKKLGYSLEQAELRVRREVVVGGQWMVV